MYLAYNQLTGCIPAGLRDVAENDFIELEMDFCEEEEPTLLDRFDTDKSGAIDKNEVLGAISAYLFGVEGDVTKDDVLAVIEVSLIAQQYSGIAALPSGCQLLIHQFKAVGLLAVIRLYLFGG